VENLTELEYAWMVYLVGAVGCCLATWLLFRRTGRAWVHLFVITVAVLLFTPFSINLEGHPMQMAPAIYSLVFGFFEGGVDQAREVLKLLIGLWGVLMVLSLIYQLLTRHSYRAKLESRQALEVTAEEVVIPPSRPQASARKALDDHLDGEPIRAVR